MQRFILASASPARRNLLRQAGLDFDVVVSGVDEEAVQASDAGALAGVLAGMKARAVAAGQEPGPLVLGCDSVLDFQGETLGKPWTPEEATRRWKAQRGGSGVLHTGHCLVDTATGRSAERTVATTVHFADVRDEEIEAYVATGEPLENAGAFTIDGLGGAFIAGIEGDHTNVIGLSVPTLRLLLHDLDVPLVSLWSRGRMAA